MADTVRSRKGKVVSEVIQVNLRAGRKLPMVLMKSIEVSRNVFIGDRHKKQD